MQAKQYTSLSKVFDNVIRPVDGSMLQYDWPAASRLYVMTSPSSSLAKSESFFIVVPKEKWKMGWNRSISILMKKAI